MSSLIESLFPSFFIRPMLYTICIGSNEHRRENLAFARRRLSESFPGIRFSREVDTQPLALRRADVFANQVARFVSVLAPADVLACLKKIEREAGRRSDDKCHEIVRLDIDLLTCDAKVYKPDDLHRTYVVEGLEELGLPLQGQDK